MSDDAIIAIVAVIPPTIAALAALFVSLRNYQQGKEIHKEVNSKTTALNARLDEANALIASMSEDKGRIVEESKVKDAQIVGLIKAAQ